VNQPFVITETVNTPPWFADPYRGRVDPFPYLYSPATAKFSFPMSLFTVPAPALTSPYAHQMNFTVEKALPAGMVLKAGYVGKLEHNLLQMVQKNPSRYIAASPPLPTRSAANPAARNLRQLPRDRYQFERGLPLAAVLPIAALQQRPDIHGLVHVREAARLYSAQNLGQTPQDPFNNRADRARSDEDKNHVFSGSFVYEIPLLRRKRWMEKAFGGWALSGLITKSSGLPVYIVSGRDFSLTGVGFDRPDLVGSPYRSFSSRADMIARYFNTGRVCGQPARQVRLPPRANIFSGPGAANTDVSLVKSFPIGERLGKLQFRAEFFNTLNQVSSEDPSPI